MSRARKVREAEAALSGVQDDHVAVSLVRAAAKSKRGRISDLMKGGNLALKIIRRLDGVDLRKNRVERMGTSLFDRGFVHARCVKIADQLHIAGRVRLLRSLFEDLVRNIAIVLGKRVKAAPSGFGRRDRSVLDPGSVSVLKEIVTGIGTRVHTADIKGFSLSDSPDCQRIQHESRREKAEK